MMDLEIASLTRQRILNTEASLLDEGKMFLVVMIIYFLVINVFKGKQDKKAVELRTVL